MSKYLLNFPTSSVLHFVVRNVGFKVDGTFNSASDKQFNETLNSTGVTRWGLKDIADLKKVAEPYNLKLQEKIDMPSNNFSLIFARK